MPLNKQNPRVYAGSINVSPVPPSSSSGAARENTRYDPAGHNSQSASLHARNAPVSATERCVGQLKYSG
jgi:hypothetical protein